VVKRNEIHQKRILVMIRLLYWFVFSSIFGTSFSLFGQIDSSRTIPRVKTPVITNLQFKVRNSRKLHKQLDKLPIFKNSFAGFCIYDVEKQEYIVQQNDRRYFTPASNTKLLTFYAALKLLDKKIPALKYTIQGDSLIFWGTGNPTFLHPKFPDQEALDFLKHTKLKLYFSDTNFKDKHLGAGWAWDDYNNYYSKEKSVFPMYNNSVRFYLNKSGRLKVYPSFFQDSLRRETKEKHKKKFWILRDLAQNQFLYYLPNKLEKAHYQEVPIKNSSQLTAKMLSEALDKKVKQVTRTMRTRDSIRTLYTMKRDVLCKWMLETSDNFWAEQILWLCADSLNGSKVLNTNKIIKKIKNEFLADLSEPPHWVDGSGLSRYNLLTPRSIVQLLLKIKKEYGKTEADLQHIFELLPQSGEGTLRHRFEGNPPFIFGKTGTLSHNHNLSGYLVTKSGKLLVFSYMNNHYMTKTKYIKQQTDKILTDFYLYY